MVFGFPSQKDRKSRTISINQQFYIEAIADRFGLTSMKPILMPMDPGVKLSKDQCPSTPMQIVKMQGTLYAEAIGSVLWPIMILQLDCIFTLSTLGQFVQNLGMAHWEALKRVIIYLNSTQKLWLTFGRHRKNFAKGYCDADWAGQPHHHSISGYLFHMGQGAVSWKSKKQYVLERQLPQSLLVWSQTPFCLCPYYFIVSALLLCIHPLYLIVCIYLTQLRCLTYYY